MRAISMSDDEVKGTDYLAKEVMLTPGKKMGRIGFVHHNPKKAKPMAKKPKPAMRPKPGCK